MKTVGKILSFIMCALAILICVLVIVMNLTDGDGAISRIAWTEEMIEEYRSYPDSFSVEYVTAYEDRYFTADGYFSVSCGRYVPDCDQWQFTLRYNKSTLEALGEERETEMPREDHHFTFSLVDTEGKEYRDFLWKRADRGRYTYYRLIFDGIDISATDDLQIMIYCIDDMEGDELPAVAVGKLPLYYSELPRENYGFKKELPDNMEPTPGFLSGDQLLKG